MGATPPVGKHKNEESTHGVLFRLGARAGLLAFAGVMVLATWQGMDPTLAFLRGLVALLILTVCGWAAERLTAAAATAKPVAEPEEPEEPGAQEQDSQAAESKPAAA